MDGSSAGSSPHGILQETILEWVAMPLLQGIFLTQGTNLSPLCLLQWQVGSLPREAPCILWEGVNDIFHMRELRNSGLDNGVKVIRMLLEPGIKFRSLGLPKHVLSLSSPHLGPRRDDLDQPHVTWLGCALWKLHLPPVTAVDRHLSPCAALWSLHTPPLAVPFPSCAFVPELPAWTLLGPQIPVGTPSVQLWL